MSYVLESVAQLQKEVLDLRNEVASLKNELLSVNERIKSDNEVQVTASSRRGKLPNDLSVSSSTFHYIIYNNLFFCRLL